MGLYYLVEWMMYAVAVICIITAIMIPEDPVSYTYEHSDKLAIEGTVHHDDITAIMLLIKFFVAFLALFPFGLGLVSRKLRRKNQRLRLLKR